jgi:hypothetical protein
MSEGRLESLRPTHSDIRPVPVLKTHGIVSSRGNASALPELLSHFGSAVTRKFMA